jgi:hypothetical protein
MSTNSNILEDNIDQLSDSGYRKTINILEASQSKEVSWWINEQDSLELRTVVVIIRKMDQMTS